jgi:hypothetical protein
MDLNICILVGLRYHIFSTHPPYPYKLFPWVWHTQLNIMGYKGDALKSQLRWIQFGRGRPPRLSWYPRLASAKRLSLPQIQACHLRQTCSKWQKSMGRLQRWRIWRMASRAGWNITLDARPHCPSLSAWWMSWKRYWAANRQGAGDATLVEGCPCVKNGERCKQTHPAWAICRGRRRRGKYFYHMDGEQLD